MRIKNLMEGPESLIAEYDVKEWQSKTYTGQDPDKVCCPDLKEMYKGIVRDTVRLTGEDEQCSETA